MHVDDMNDLVQMGLARDQAHAEIERLRAALQEIADMADDYEEGDAAWLVCQAARVPLKRES